MAHPLPDDGKAVLLQKNVKEVLSKAEKIDSAAIGPGIGEDEETKKFVLQLLPELSIPIVIDADGLNALAGNTDIFKKISSNLVLTPHPGEFSRLTGISIDDIQKDRIDVTSEFAVKWGVHIVLKGYRTCVASPEGDVHICMTGNPGMATGGSGDVLTGIITALLAAGVPPLDAARLGAHVHGCAGDLAVQDKTEISLKAGDLIDYLPSSFRELTDY